MVKLFVGNLADAVDSTHLRELFSQFVEVQECDVLKNFAFVHVKNDEDAKRCVEQLDNFMLEGRPIHIEQSTSRLRKEPGMGDKCFRCGGYDHKTPNCPIDKGEDSVRRNRRRPSPGFPTNGSKRPPPSGSNFSDPSYPPAKRGSSPPSWGYNQPGYDPYRRDPYYGGGPPQARAVGGDPDPLLPRPRDRDVEPLYDQYAEARQRYYYYRDRLTKEMQARAQDPYATAAQQPAYAHAGGQQYAQYDYSAQAAAQAAQPAAAPVVRYPDVYGGYQAGQPPAAPAYPYGAGYAGATAAAPSAQPPYMASYGVQQGAQPALNVMKTEPRMY
uniref:RRM domain-containing protein n=1 Tax=Plectus sambesii TaxID=2011161 RepID=A0A914W2Y3_9BILA